MVCRISAISLEHLVTTCRGQQALGVQSSKHSDSCFFSLKGGEDSFFAHVPRLGCLPAWGLPASPTAAYPRTSLFFVALIGNLQGHKNMSV
eukprot:563509-Pelagomonas_calceolata.AAC.1